MGKADYSVHAPIRFLSKDRGVFIPFPENNCSAEQICLQTAKTIKEVGEALTAAGKALEDGSLSRMNGAMC